MTANGTNTYVIGDKEVVVVDPGPVNEAHKLAIIAAVAGRTVRHVLVTHTHHDHSPAAVELKDEFACSLLGPEPTDDDYQDTSFVPDQIVGHGDVIGFDDFQLEAVHTPGHVGNHFCYFLATHGLMITGDHIMSGSTVVIIPPSGDMTDYLNSLEIMKSYPLKLLAPGHGDVIESPLLEVQRLIDHRLRREAKVLLVMQDLLRGTLDELTPHVYDDVDPALHPIAAFSLWAHLIKLQKDGKVKEQNRDWYWL
jgi:glyoxylase-like metal-dependent hydrolase (beta-lactamase superfamily II)